MNKLDFLRQTYLGANASLEEKAKELPLDSTLRIAYFKKISENRTRFTTKFLDYFLPSLGTSKALNLGDLANAEPVRAAFEKCFPVVKKFLADAVLLKEVDVDLPVLLNGTLYLPKTECLEADIAFALLTALTPKPVLYFRFLYSPDTLSPGELTEVLLWK